MSETEVREKLAEVYQASFIDKWLNSPNDRLGGKTPLQSINDCETREIERMLYYLRSGMPS